jgi:hypothetical protein
MMDELRKKWNARNICFVSQRKIYNELFSMYSDIPFYPLDLTHDEYAPYLKHRNVEYKKTKFHIHHCTIDESLSWLKKHQNGDTSHAIDSYKEFAGIKEFTPVAPQFSEELKQTTLEKVKELNLNKFVFLTPESNGALALPTEFWTTLTGKLQQKGYDIFVNTAKGVTPFGKSVCLTIAEATYLASLAQAIIGLRCGFLECLAALRDRHTLYTLYTPFRSMQSDAFFKTYTLQNYPFVNKNIVELIVNPGTENEVLEKIYADL